MLLEDALALLTGEVCLRVHSVIAGATRELVIRPGRIEEGAHTSWLAAESQLFTILKNEGQTLVFCHSNQTMYYGSPAIALTGECPDGHSFLVQALEDAQPGTELKMSWELPGIPRVLVMDLVTPVEPSPQRRRETLWAMRNAFPPLCTVQWAGERAALDAFLAQGLPHAVQAVVAFGEPLRITKELTLTIPGPKLVEPGERKRAREDSN